MTEREQIVACRTCRHYNPDGRPEYAEKAGHCTRFPPQIVWLGYDYDQQWPWMQAGDWCGEHTDAANAIERGDFIKDKNDG